MRQIAGGPLGSELQKADSRAIMPQKQSPAPIEVDGFLSREGEGPLKPLFTMGCELIARMFSYLFEMIAHPFANHGSVSEMKYRASEPPELRINPSISKQPCRQIIESPRTVPATIPPNVTYVIARQTSSALSPPKDAARATRPAPSSDWSAGNPSYSTAPSSSRPRSAQISVTSRHVHRSNNNPVIRASGERHLISSENLNPKITSARNLNPRMLLTYKPTNKKPK